MHRPDEGHWKPVGGDDVPYVIICFRNIRNRPVFWSDLINIGSSPAVPDCLLLHWRSHFHRSCLFVLLVPPHSGRRLQETRSWESDRRNTHWDSCIPVQRSLSEALSAVLSFREVAR